MAIYIRNYEEFEHMIVTMHVDGWGIRALARHFEISRNTVRRILRRNSAGRDKGFDILPSKGVYEVLRVSKDGNKVLFHKRDKSNHNHCDTEKELRFIRYSITYIFLCFH